MFIGLNLLNNFFLNKGIVFIKEEWVKYGIIGMFLSIV